MKWWKPFCILLITGIFFTCIDPYYPELNNFQSLLVVDALLTDENISNYVRLSRTIRNSDEVPERITGAEVMIMDDQQNTVHLTETSSGTYKTDSLSFRGETGRTYRLLITTAEGEEYESEPCVMYPVQDIDNIYFEKGEELSDDGDRMDQGIRFFIDSEGQGECDYFRWTFEEWWKFSVPDPKMFDYFNDSTILEVEHINQTCWGNIKSDNILIHSAQSGTPAIFEKKPVLFVESEKTDRLLIRYCVEIKQLSLSPGEYEFWDQMRQINESGGDIFDKQPFQIFSNIHNINDRDEQVLGFFQVSGVKKLKKYVNLNEILELDLPVYQYNCSRIAKGPSDYITQTPPGPPTFDEIYSMYINSGYVFIAPVYNITGELERLVFTKSGCSDCTYNGSLKKPDFWTD